MKRRIANRWRKTFLWFPRRVVTVTPNGDEVNISWIWGSAYMRYSVFQGRFMGVTYSKSDK